LGQIGRFAAADAVVYPRGAEVICRTRRGLEVGVVMSHSDRGVGRDAADGTILRGVTPQDHLLLARQRKNRDQAFAACQQLLAEHQVTASLVDVEHLFDGTSLIFYFLGSLTADAVRLVDALAAAYDAEVKFAEFSRAVEAGCGPACGTKAATGCGDACSVCAVAHACKSAHR
jgi:cell fate regulator YaaT (PSP1 superfamily)